MQNTTKKLSKFLILSFFIIILTSSIVSASNWWDPNWQHRRLIEVQEISGNDLSEYSIHLIIPHELTMQENFEDLRFTTISGNQTIPHWIETSNNISADVWVKLPRLDPNGQFKFYLYFGNQTVQSTSDLKSSFILADDFEDGIIDSSMWINTSDWIETNGYAYALHGTSYLKSIEKFDQADNLELWMKTKKVRNNDGDYHSFGFADFQSDNTGGYFHWMNHANAGSDALWITSDKGGIASQNMGVNINGAIVDSTFLWNSTRNNLTIQNGDDKFNWQGTSNSQGTESVFFGLGPNHSTDIYVYEVRLNKFAEPSPNYNFNNLETYSNQSLPDLTILDMVYLPSFIEIGETVTANITVINLGSEQVGTFEWKYNFDYPNGSNSRNINAGESLNILINHTYDLGGYYTFYFELDPQDIIQESNESNNQGTMTIFVNGTPDMSPVLIFKKQDPINPRKFSFVYNIENKGTIFAENIEGSIDFGDGTGAGINIANIPPGENYTTVINHIFPKFKDYLVKVNLDPNNSIYESNESNNQVETLLNIEDNSQANITVNHLAQIGTTINIFLTDGLNPYRNYTLLMSDSMVPPLTLPDRREIPLEYNQIFKNMLSNSTNYGFSNAQSQLNHNGTSTVTWTIPNNQNYIGKTVYFSFVTSLEEDLEINSEIYSIAPSVPVMLLP
jgi:hypothetical protein